MIKHLVARDLNVTCHDGSCHENVTLNVCNGKRIFTTPDGCKLCVEKINGGMFLVSARLATMIQCSCPIEMESSQ